MRDGHLCRECGTVVDPEKQVSAKARLGMIRHRLCRECLRWKDVLDRILEPGNLRISGIQYWVRHDIPPVPNAVLHAILTDGGQLITTSALVRMGRVPDHFTTRLADNAVFIEEMDGEA